MSVPDALAYLRILLIPAILALIVPTDPIDHAFGIAAVLMWIASTTDFLDGYLARRWKQTTQLRRLPRLHRRQVARVGCSLWTGGGGSGVGLGSLRHRRTGDRGVGVTQCRRHGWRQGGGFDLGKAKANTQYLAIFMALLRTPDKYGGLYPDQWVMLLAVVVTVMSGYGYFARFARVLRAARARA